MPQQRMTYLLVVLLVSEFFVSTNTMVIPIPIGVIADACSASDNNVPTANASSLPLAFESSMRQVSRPSTKAGEAIIFAALSKTTAVNANALSGQHKFSNFGLIKTSGVY